MHRQLVADAAATDDKWVRAEATARALYKRGDYNGALQTLFTGKAVGHPNLGPSTLARMLLFGRVKTSDLPDPEHRWIDSVIPRIPEYIGSQVLHAYVADGDMRQEDQRSVPLNEFWEVCKMKGSEWPAKMDAEAYVLGKVLQAIDGTTYLNVQLSERYRDVWRSAQLARPVGAAFAALGMAKDGECTIRHTITVSSGCVTGIRCLSEPALFQAGSTFRFSPQTPPPAPWSFSRKALCVPLPKFPSRRNSGWATSSP